MCRRSHLLCICFFRTDSVILHKGKSEELCKKILNIYKIMDEQKQMYHWHKETGNEFKNLSLRIILTSGLPIMDFEVLYLQNCLLKAPYENANAFFNIALQGTLDNYLINLDDYLNILFVLGNKDKILAVFGEIISNNIDRSFYAEDFIAYHRYLKTREPDKAKHIQKVAELFLICFKLRDSDIQNELCDYFYSLPTHDEIYSEVFAKMSNACNTEENHG